MADRMTKSAEVIEAATDVFLRYGLAKTTMGDIAAAARISRPALYLVFPSKEDVFAAVIRRMDATWHAELAAALERQPTPEARLRHACGEWAAHGIGVVARDPDAQDLFGGQLARRGGGGGAARGHAARAGAQPDLCDAWHPGRRDDHRGDAAAHGAAGFGAPGRARTAERTVGASASSHAAARAGATPRGRVPPTIQVGTGPEPRGPLVSGRRGRFAASRCTRAAPKSNAQRQANEAAARVAIVNRGGVHMPP
jgi:AcrR family transcriptional regulator